MLALGHLASDICHMTNMNKKISSHPSLSQRLRRTAALLLLPVFAWVACGSDNGSSSDGPADEAEPIRLGLLVPISGPWVKGAAWRQAARMAIDEINAQGGVLDRPLEMLVIDIARPRRS
jgi:ABC-type branched-subunit amino acid transport system substrate-binding protein